MIRKNLKKGDTFTDSGRKFIVDEVVGSNYVSHVLADTDEPVKATKKKKDENTGEPAKEDEGNG